METPYEIVTFDCYGTLVDWEAGISRAVRDAAARDGIELDRKRIVTAHAEVEPGVQSAGFRNYRDVLVETALRMAPRLGWSLAPDRATFLPDSLVDWPIFDETNEALGRLISAGMRLGILSNIDDDLLAGTLRQFEVEFSLVVTAQQTRSYKPDHGHFVTARERIGRGRWLHAAQSYFHDVVPAREAGVPVAWINRKAEEPSAEARPDREFRDLTELADWLC